MRETTKAYLSEDALRPEQFIDNTPGRFRDPVHITIAGMPVSQNRPRGRVTKSGKGIHMYSDQKKQYEYTRAKAIAALGEDFVPFRRINALKVRFEFYIKLPVMYLRKRRTAFEGVPRIKKPDLSNYIKFYEDALNKILWFDDANIAEISAIKSYSKNPRTEIYVEEVAGEYDIIQKVPPM